MDKFKAIRSFFDPELFRPVLGSAIQPSIAPGPAHKG
jgi:hypothetical protein